MPVARCYTYSWNQDSFGERPAGLPPVPTPKTSRALFLCSGPPS